MSSADIVTISPDNIQSITTSAWTIMSPSLVNSLSTSQISVLSIDQVTALINSANVASFSISLIKLTKSIYIVIVYLDAIRQQSIIPIQFILIKIH